jgi:hypothetical protein
MRRIYERFGLSEITVDDEEELPERELVGAS